MTTSPPLDITLAQALNQGCACQTLDARALAAQLEADPALKGLAQTIEQTRSNLFSGTRVFLSEAVAQLLHSAVTTIEHVAALPAWQTLALAGADPVARSDWGPVGAFMGYDFHIGADGPRLIEINSNAGGAFLNAALARAHSSCCEAMDAGPLATAPMPDHDALFTAMFRAEWRSQRGDAPLRTLAIVDDDPAAQYLAPEFELCRHLLHRAGIAALVVNARELRWQHGRLWANDVALDMVYNRLTDFYLSEAEHGALRQAYLAGAVVLTPSPRTHALMADKRHLITLSDDALLQSWGVGPAQRTLLRQIVPASQRVSADNAAELWARRRQLFFKPLAGFGSRAAYRGDKLTRGVWADILRGDFIAQALVPPGARRVSVNGVAQDLKFDIRVYSYAGQVLLLAARTYQGQTTNFRTPGGGFAPVLVLPALADAAIAKLAPARNARETLSITQLPAPD